MITAVLLLAAAARAASFTPADDRPVRLVGAEGRLVAVYQFRLEFYALPPDARLEPGAWRAVKAVRGGAGLDLGTLTPAKVLRYKHPVKADAGPAGTAPNLLVCTQPLGAYRPQSQEEKDALRALGAEDSIAAAGPAGGLEDFCGILSLRGEVVHRFRETQAPPSVLFDVAGMSRDGRSALIAVGPALAGKGTAGGQLYPVSRAVLWRAPDQEIPLRDESGSDLAVSQWGQKFDDGKFAAAVAAPPGVEVKVPPAAQDPAGFLAALDALKGSPRRSEVLKGLRALSPDERKLAARGFLKGLKDPRPGIRHAAVPALGEVGAGSDEVLAALLEVERNDPDSDLRGSAAFALGRLGPAAAGLLAPELASERDPRMFKTLVQVLSDAAPLPKEAVGPLVAALPRVDAKARLLLASAIARSDPERSDAIPEMARSLKEADLSWDRDRAAGALALMKGPRAQEALAKDEAERRGSVRRQLAAAALIMVLGVVVLVRLVPRVGTFERYVLVGALAMLSPGICVILWDLVTFFHEPAGAKVLGFFIIVPWAMINYLPISLSLVLASWAVMGGVSAWRAARPVGRGEAVFIVLAALLLMAVLALVKIRGKWDFGIQFTMREAPDLGARQVQARV